jgi:hypothetical protein
MENKKKTKNKKDKNEKDINNLNWLELGSKRSKVTVFHKPKS